MTTKKQKYQALTELAECMKYYNIELCVIPDGPCELWVNGSYITSQYEYTCDELFRIIEDLYVAKENR